MCIRDSLHTFFHFGYFFDPTRRSKALHTGHQFFSVCHGEELDSPSSSLVSMDLIHASFNSSVVGSRCGGGGGVLVDSLTTTSSYSNSAIFSSKDAFFSRSSVYLDGLSLGPPGAYNASSFSTAAC